MAINVETLAAAMAYTKKSIGGGGAVAGKNCTIESIVPITGGNRVTFKWYLDDGTEQTATMDVMDGINGTDGKDGIDGTDGKDGTNGTDGVGIESVSVTEENHLMVTYTDGSEVDAGLIDVLLDVDSELSDVSENPVQNKIVKSAIDAKANKDGGEVKSATTEFTTINGGLLSECKVALSPNQDLHGYDHPWVGGAGKNKLEDTFNTGTLLGVDITADNGVIDLNGTGTDNNNFAIKSRNTSGNYIYMPKGNYIFSAEGIGSGVVVGTTYNGAFYEIARNDGGESAGFSITDNTPSDYKLSDGSVLVGLFINIKAQTYSHQKVYPMIRLASDTDPTFEPYENKCPITGHTEVKVGDDGKNKLPINENTISGAGFIFDTPIYLPSGTWTFSFASTVTSNTSFAVLDGDGNILANVAISSPTRNVTFTLNATGKTARFYGYAGTYSNMQIELGSTATPYVPYNGYQITVNLGGTYYSGILDIVSGVFVPDTAGVDLGTLTWTYEASWGASSNFYAIINDSLNIKRPATQDDVANAKCTQYKMVSRNEFYDSADSNIAILPTPQIKIRDSRYNDGTAFTSAMNGVMLVYELATPTPIQLSPTIVKALVGENHLSAPLDGQEITESKYRELFTWDEVESLAEGIAEDKVQDIKCHETRMGTYNVKASVDSDGNTSYVWNRASFETILLNDTIVMPPINQIRFSDSNISSSSICELLFLGDTDVPTITHVAVSSGQVTFTLSETLESTVNCTCRVTNRIL